MITNKYLFFSPSQVLNFYELRNYTHLKTVAAMDELESAVFLSRPISAALLGKEDDNHVLLCGGQSGLVRLYQVSFRVNSRSSSTRGKRGGTTGGDEGTFACCALFTLAASGPNMAVSLLATSTGSVHASTEQSRFQKPSPTQLSTSIAGLLMQEEASTLGASKVTVVTTDQSFITYRVVSSSSSSTGKRKSGKKKEVVDSGSGVLFSLERQWLAGYDDILDVSLAPLPSAEREGQESSNIDWRKLSSGSAPSSQEEEDEREKEETPQSTNAGVDVSSAFITVAATNSPHLRVKVGSTGKAGASRILYGHTDVVLSLAHSPDG